MTMFMPAWQWPTCEQYIQTGSVELIVTVNIWSCLLSGLSQATRTRGFSYRLASLRIHKATVHGWPLDWYTRFVKVRLYDGMASRIEVELDRVAYGGGDMVRTEFEAWFANIH